MKNYNLTGYNILKKLKKETNLVSFPKDTYIINYDKCHEEYHFISNHDHGLKNIAFPVSEMKDLIIDGNDSTFIFQGRVIPFIIKNSEKIVIRNLTINYDRPFFTEGKIIEANKNKVVLEIDKEKYPFYIKDDKIYFISTTGGWENSYIKWFIEFDKNRKRPVHKQGGSDLRTQNVKALLLENGNVEFTANFKEVHTTGNIINITHEQRYNPGILITESSNVTLENITINHAGAMGIIAQNSKDITLRKVQIKPDEDSGRMVSTNNDATHFVNCEGHINIENCYFSSQLDDGVNVHGIYNTISEIYSKNFIELEINHFQQYGINIYRPGDKIAFVNRKTHLYTGFADVVSTEIINKKYIVLGIKYNKDTIINIEDCVSNFEKMPELTIKNTTFQKNRARGILASTNKKTIIENNYFQTSGSSICCGGELDFWFESGPINDITIRNNEFDNCVYAKWGKSIISINTEVKDVIPDEYINNTILVEHNDFKIVEPPIATVTSTKNFVFRNNNIIQTRGFLPFKNIQTWFIKDKQSNLKYNNNNIIGIESKELMQ